MLERTERELSPAEQQSLSRRIADERKRARKFFKPPIIVVGLVVGVMCIVILLTSNAPKLVIAIFGIVLWLGLTVWNCYEENERSKPRIRELESALEKNRAQVLRLQATAVAVIKENDDEGDWYVFELSGEKLFFLSGYDFPVSKKFPNTDFEIVQVIGARSCLLHQTIKTYGQKLAVMKTVKSGNRFPNNHEVLDGRLSELESLLGSHR